MISAKRGKKNILNLGTNRPGYNIQFHPRAFSKPIQCQVGHHSLKPGVVNGVPCLVCSKCGSYIGKGIYEKTMTKHDIKKQALGIQRRTKPRTKKEIIEELWEKQEEDRRERMNRSIAKFVKDRMLDEL